LLFIVVPQTVYQLVIGTKVYFPLAVRQSASRAVASLPFGVFVMSKLLLIVTALVEVVTGLALLIAPSQVVQLLLGEGLSSPQSLVLGRVTGAALISMGVACWLASNGESSGRRGLVGSMLIYNLAVPVLLICAAIADGMRGVALWPASIVHIGLTIWCVVCLQWR
jgi:hypothetical protein